MTQSYWQAVARSVDVGRKPFRVHFSGRPIVIFRTATGLQALLDRCPHRHVELSKGKVVGETIECPYHGWRFNGSGECVDIPGCLAAVPAVRVPNLAICEREGGIFLAQSAPQADPVVHPMQHDTCVRQIVKSETKSTLVDAAENILDATHTHYTHKGLLRGLSAKRQKVSVAVKAGPDWVEAVYTGEDKQDGLVSKLLDGARTKTVGRFRHPGIAELEYWGPRGLVLATSFHLRQVGPDRVEGVGWLVGPKENGLGYLKATFFKPMFRVALAQDRRILKSAFDNAEGAQPVIGPLDFLRRDIEAISKGKPPNAEPRQFEILL
jgi:phenylpropionate dioxygenase-like ring-hydroxylating dioxygenase large terminal subunit